jgi:hypothetical protein
MPAPDFGGLGADDVDDVEPGEVVDRAVAPGEVVRDIESEEEREVLAAMRDVGRDGPSTCVGPVDDPETRPWCHSTLPGWKSR